MSNRKDPYRNFRFRIEIDGIAQAGFSEAIMPDASADVIEYREGSELPAVRKLLGRIKYGNITLKGGITDSLDLYNWWKLVEQGNMEDARRNMSVILMDEEGSDNARWDFKEAWPVRYKPSDLEAKGTEVVIETLEIAHEKMTRVQ